MFDNIQRCVQLHEHFEVLYVVDGYIGQIYTLDGLRLVIEVKGDDLEDMLHKLNYALDGKDLKYIRSRDTIDEASISARAIRHMEE